ncbi:MAG: hypothetical protein KGO96_11955 [Elusimicrobia bacterium]|nr:hypothetical protein [Elusimicrobiota bacterium]MDE2426609.1 hypothetical protein [Elusimicrobiota bacterium]
MAAVSAILVYVGGYGLSKIAPLLFGMCAANVYSHKSYALILNLIVQANFLTAVSSVGYVQLILTGGGAERKSGEGAAAYAFRAVLFAALVSLLGGCWAAYTAAGAGTWSRLGAGFVVACYSFGSSTLGTAIGHANAELENARAGLLYAVGIVIPYLIGFVLVWLGRTDCAAFESVAAAIAVLSLCAYWAKNRDYVLNLSGGEALALARRAIPLEASQIYCMIFMGAVLYSHSFTISRVISRNGASLAAVFALGYQLFAVGIAVPGIMGNVVVPRLVRRRGGKGSFNVNYLFALYAAFALAWLAIVFTFAAPIMGWYSLAATPGGLAILRILQLAAVLGAVNALVYQKFAARRDFLSMALLALLYAGVVFLFLGVAGAAALRAAWGILIAYAVTLSAGLVLYQLRYGETAEELPEGMMAPCVEECGR